MPRPPRLSRAEILLRQEIDRWKTTAVLLRTELETKCRHVERLQYLIMLRAQRIDDLTGKLDQVRAQNRRLDEEAERLAEMIKLSSSL